MLTVRGSLGRRSADRCQRKPVEFWMCGERGGYVHEGMLRACVRFPLLQACTCTVNCMSAPNLSSSGCADRSATCMRGISCMRATPLSAACMHALFVLYVHEGHATRDTCDPPSAACMHMHCCACMRACCARPRATLLLHACTCTELLSVLWDGYQQSGATCIRQLLST
jgi:hypothetical protein